MPTAGLTKGPAPQTGRARANPTCQAQLVATSWRDDSQAERANAPSVDVLLASQRHARCMPGYVYPTSDFNLHAVLNEMEAQRQ
ncbi:hypothetical protein PsYK624_164160 [Phanerochaete sordida]|uniref:Uncharacterized protein n=1 Tax=Phanerochaete sordida TaxID=48140 RepID=A0A9P3LM28_9APHY|nr:hypothetical protein PsYK624_164160 [Phanerochaete sordida]